MKVNKIEGGGLKVGQIKDFLNASYAENPPNQLGDYQLDIELSNAFGKVYFSISKKNVVIIFRGTAGNLQDWENNLWYAINSNAYKLTNRFRIAKKMYDEAHRKYKGYKFTLSGHSQGGLPTNIL